MKTIFTNGCFDVLHYGHIQFLQRCRAMGSRLIVGVNSDESVKRLKGETRPIHNQNQRTSQLSELRSVDSVIVFAEDTPCETIRKIRPDIIVKGPGYSPGNMPEAAVVSEWGGKVVILDGPDLSTTTILRRLEK